MSSATKCPYCNTDCFVPSKTIEIKPYNTNPYSGEWINECVNGHISKSVVSDDGILTQIPINE